MKKTTSTTRTRKSGRTYILGMPIEGTTNIAEALVEMKPRKADKVIKTRTPRIPKGPTSYQGAPIPCTRLLTRKMPEFKKTTADCLLIINTVGGTFTFANTYKAGNLPPSYDPAKYTYGLTDKAQKKLDKKIEEQGFVEVEPTDWPPFVTSAGPAKKKEKPIRVRLSK